MTEHNALYQRIMQTKQDHANRRAAFRAAGPTAAQYKKMSQVRQAERDEQENAYDAQSGAIMLGELMTIACELFTPMEMVALTTRVAVKDGKGTSVSQLANKLVHELVETALDIERERVVSILRAA